MSLLCRNIAPWHKLEHTIEVAKNKNGQCGGYDGDNGDVNLGSAGERGWIGARIRILIYTCKCKHRCDANYDCPEVRTSFK